MEGQYDVARTARFLRETNTAAAALQFPDELLHDAPSVVAALSRALRRADTGAGAAVPVRLSVLGDSTFGACCVDEVAAAHTPCDAIVHYGHACMSAPSGTPVLYVFEKAAVDAPACGAALRALLDDGSNIGTVLLLWDPDVTHAVPAVLHAAAGDDGAVGGDCADCRAWRDGGVAARGGAAVWRHAPLHPRLIVPDLPSSALPAQRSGGGSSGGVVVATTSGGGACCGAAGADAGGGAGSATSAVVCACAEATSTSTAPSPAATADSVLADTTQETDHVGKPLTPAPVATTCGFRWAPPPPPVDAAPSDGAPPEVPLRVLYVGRRPARLRAIVAQLAHASVFVWDPSEGGGGGGGGGEGGGAAGGGGGPTQFSVTESHPAATADADNGGAASASSAVPARPAVCVAGPSASASASPSADPALSRLLSRRYRCVEAVRGARIVGLVAGTTGVARHGAVLDALRAAADAAGVASYTLIVGRPTPAKLANFPEADAFVLVACAENALLGDAAGGGGGSEFAAPVATPWEAFVALGARAAARRERRAARRSGAGDGEGAAPAVDPLAWGGGIVLDFDALLARVAAAAAAAHGERGGAADGDGSDTGASASDDDDAPMHTLLRSGGCSGLVGGGGSSARRQTRAGARLAQRPAGGAGGVCAAAGGGAGADASALALRADADRQLTLPAAAPFVSAGAAFLRERREWRGLAYEAPAPLGSGGGGDGGGDGSTRVYAGAMGTASGYAHERGTS